LTPKDNILLDKFLQAMEVVEPTARDFCQTVGWLMVLTGKHLYREFYPDQDSDNLKLVEANYYQQPGFASAFILQGHLMLGLWQSAEKDDDITNV
jgi:hypothetical protein